MSVKLGEINRCTNMDCSGFIRTNGPYFVSLIDLKLESSFHHHFNELISYFQTY